ncbi:MAG: hypothetical protein ACYC6L_06135 [Anaerolineae bacterium]
MRRVVNGIVYNTEEAALLAENTHESDIWEPQLQPDRFLYVTPKGRYFIVRQYRHDPDKDILVPFHRWAALKLYRRLQKHHVSEEEAFGPIIEDAFEDEELG